MNVSHIINLQDGKPKSISMVIGTKPYTLAAGHISFHEIVKELANEKPDGNKILKLLSKGAAINAFSDGKVTREGDKFYFNGEELHGTLVGRIKSFMKEGLPWKPLFRFLENLMKNPSKPARESLFRFLENEALPITPDGCFIGYKGAEANYWSKNRGYIPHTMLKGQQNHINQLFYGKGEVLLVPRSEVVEDPRVDCARGIHVGSFKYANNWATSEGALVVVKVNPADVVSVPFSAKEVMRVCGLEVVEVLAVREALKQQLEPQFLPATDEDAPKYHSVRDKNGRFVKAVKR